MKSNFRIEAISNKRQNLGINVSPELVERRYLLFPNDNAVTKTLFAMR